MALSWSSRWIAARATGWPTTGVKTQAGNLNTTTFTMAVAREPQTLGLDRHRGYNIECKAIYSPTKGTGSGDVRGRREGGEVGR